jgi:DNA polymerase (family 10)
MPGAKAEFIALLNECAELMELRGENPFRCRAYENAARALQGVEGDPADWLTDNRLEGIRGIGQGMADHIREWVETGKLEQFEKIKAELPPILLELVRIPGIGPKKARVLHADLGVDSLERLEAAAKDGTIARHKGFGEKTAERILAGLEQHRKFSERSRLDVARAEAQLILERLHRLKSVKRLDVAGSLRRCRETVRDLDFVVESEHPETVMKVFVTLPNVSRVTNHGPTKSSVVLASGMAADLRVVDHEQFAAALNYFTGSKEHNTRLRGRAKKLGCKLNEYGLFRETTERPVPCREEADIYRRLGLRYIEPELREDMGEIEAAESGGLPRLITRADMRGLLHCHSTYSDGRSSLREMAEAAREAGYAYFGICDHSRSAGYAHGMSEDTVLRQHDEIERLNRELQGIVVLKGVESDILDDGRLDYEDRFLERFDFVVASIHSRFNLNRKEMTRRICRALEHPATVILGHPTGRLLLQREPYEVDMDEVLETAAAHRVAVEINANPHRLDLDWRLHRQAKRLGCLLSINPDAHNAADIGDVSYGIGIARKGWVEASDVINTLPLDQFRGWLRSRRERPAARTHPAARPKAKAT